MPDVFKLPTDTYEYAVNEEFEKISLHIKSSKKKRIPIILTINGKETLIEPEDGEINITIEVCDINQTTSSKKEKTSSDKVNDGPQHPELCNNGYLQKVLFSPVWPL